MTQPNQSLDEWVDSSEAARLLKVNLITNLEQLDIDDQEKAFLLRMHMTMVRQFAAQYVQELVRETF